DRARAGVIGAACAHPADAGCTGEFDGEAGGVCHHDVTHAAVAIDQRGRWSPLQHADARARVHRAALERQHIAREAKDAVGIRPGEIGFQHRACDGGGVGPVEAAGAKSVDKKRPQGGGGNAADGVGFGFGQHVRSQHCATAISSGKLSTHSWPVSVTMKVCPRKMPNIPSAVIGLGSAMMIMPGLSTLSISSASVRSAKTCGLSVTISMPCTCVGRDCTPCSRKKRLASRILSVALPGLISAMILRYPGSVISSQNFRTISVGGPSVIGDPIWADRPL